MGVEREGEMKNGIEKEWKREREKKGEGERMSPKISLHTFFFFYGECGSYAENTNR